MFTYNDIILRKACSKFTLFIALGVEYRLVFNIQCFNIVSFLSCNEKKSKKKKAIDCCGSLKLKKNSKMGLVVKSLGAADLLLLFI